MQCPLENNFNTQNQKLLVKNWKFLIESINFPILVNDNLNTVI